MKHKFLLFLILSFTILSLFSFNPFLMLFVPMVVYRDKPKTNSWIRWMVRRVMRDNQNNLIAIVGGTGSGKTYFGLSIAEIYSKLTKVKFSVVHVVFSLTELMQLINSGTLQKGSIIIFDEPQCSISAREFQSEANKVFNYLLSTFRHRNFTLIFCTPYMSLLDKSTRKLFHAEFKTMSIDRSNNTCRVSPRYLEWVDFREEPYKKCLQVAIKNDYGGYKINKLSYWDIGKPSEELIEQYEQKKREFTDRLNRNIELRLKKMDSITQEPEPPKRKPLTDRQAEVMKVLANHKYEEAEKILGISLNAIFQNKELSEKKGYTLEEFKSNVE